MLELAGRAALPGTVGEARRPVAQPGQQLTQGREGAAAQLLGVRALAGSARGLGPGLDQPQAGEDPRQRGHVPRQEGRDLGVRQASQMPPERVDEILRHGGGTQWDPLIIDAYVKCRERLKAVRERGIGESLRNALDGALRHALGDRRELCARVEVREGLRDRPPYSP